jgi:phosphoglycerate dehydrogenase-like enzyme
MIRLLVESDAILRVVPVILDPQTAPDHQRAIADFFAHDEPDFFGWCDRVRQQIPGLYPAALEFARDQAEFRAKLPNADAAIVESLEVGETELAAAPKLVMVQKFGSLVGNIDLTACARRNVAVDIQRRRVNVAVAEQAFAMMIALAKMIPALDGVVTESALRQKGHNPAPFDRRYTGNSNFARITGLKTLSGATLGIIGMGEIGREIARRAAGFEMKILYHQRNRINPLEENAMAARYASLDEVLTGSDYVAIQLPSGPATRGILGRAQLQRMKKGAILINVARADLVDHDALIEVLQSRHLGGFALDVGYEEPMPPSEKLLQFKDGNVLLMPHTAVAERQNGLLDMEEMCLKLWRGTKMRQS